MTRSSLFNAPGELEGIGQRMYDLATFSLHDMTECGAALRAAGHGARYLEEVAQRTVEYFYDGLRMAAAGERACVLVRWFTTVEFQDLPEDLKSLALARSPSNTLLPQTKCLTLMATTGQEEVWRSRSGSRGHQVIPLATPENVASSPMISQLLRQLGVEIAELPPDNGDIFLANNEYIYNVFHVENAVGSPFVPGQKDFVLPYGVRSVLGYGGLLPSGNLLALIMFTRVPVTHEIAAMFRPLALDSLYAATPFDCAICRFEDPDPNCSPEREEHIAFQLNTLSRLVEVHEGVVLEQSRRLDAVLTELRRDVDKRQRVERELKEATKRAEAANQAKSQFLANMSHEIRTPLNGIIGMTELALGVATEPALREYLELIEQSADALLVIINDILDISKIESQEFRLDESAFSAAEAIGDAITALAGNAHHKHLELICHVDPDVPDILVGDQFRLKQIITNLVGNAIKFTDEGEVIVRVEQEAMDEATSLLHIAVSDTGPGIELDKQESIFEAFTQVDASSTRKHGGTGLGLAICRHLAHRMGGHIDVASVPGRGSTFHVRLRFRRQVRSTPALPASALERLRGLAILVVDDNETNRLILAEVLRRWGMEPTVVGSGAAALDSLREAQAAGDSFAMALIDGHMPEMDGLMLCDAIRQQHALDSMALVIMSSGGLVSDAEKRRELGITGFLLKPLRQSRLLETLSSIADAQATTITRRARATGRISTGPHGLQVLLVEDGAVNQKLAMGQLRKRDHQITIARTGREALDILARREFDIVLMDVQMPEMDGLEATRLIRARERETGGYVPIVAMTAHAMKGDSERCLAAGMNAYVAKPLRASQLFAAMDEALMAAAAQRQETELVSWDTALEHMDGDRELLGEIVEEMLIEGPRLVTEIERAAAARDAAAVTRHTHSLLGAARAFGSRLDTSILAVENAAQRGELDRVPGLVIELAARMKLFFAVLASSPYRALKSRPGE